MIREKCRKEFSVTDIVGKKNMCCQPGIEALQSRQFHDYCTSVREAGQCEFFNNFRNSDTNLKVVIDSIKREPQDSEKTVEMGRMFKVCPYEAAALCSKDSAVIIADYYYIFNQVIRDGFLKKSGKELENLIIIVDEAHNLPQRIREMLTERISTSSVERAVKEAERFAGDDERIFLSDLREALFAIGTERIVGKNELLELLKGHDIEDAAERLGKVGEEVRETQRQSSIAGVADFLGSWVDGDDEGFARIASRKQGPKGPIVSLSYQCLDPGFEASKVVRSAYSVIMMSGTLTPTGMYRDMLGFPKGTVEREYRNPFPAQNRLSLIVTGVTTRFSKRDDRQFEKLADVCVNITNEIPGNVAVFFPSYAVMREVFKHMHGKIVKNVMLESPGISKEEKVKIISDFKRSFLVGGVLLAVVGGNFYEGIDLPGNLLNGVIIVGLPLAQPDLETKKLIDYYEARYKKGWDYGYVFPAFTKALQTAGRCIRSELDRGVIIFMDERYAWANYYSCFPKDMKPKITANYREYIREFFNTRQSKLG